MVPVYSESLQMWANGQVSKPETALKVILVISS
jgi:hypothetical protein